MPRSRDVELAILDEQCLIFPLVGGGGAAAVSRGGRETSRAGWASRKWQHNCQCPKAGAPIGGRTGIRGQRSWTESQRCQSVALLEESVDETI